jgi:hypothetical protein
VGTHRCGRGSLRLPGALSGFVCWSAHLPEAAHLSNLRPLTIRIRTAEVAGTGGWLTASNPASGTAGSAFTVGANRLTCPELEDWHNRGLCSCRRQTADDHSVAAVARRRMTTCSCRRQTAGDHALASVATTVISRTILTCPELGDWHNRGLCRDCQLLPRLRIVPIAVLPTSTPLSAGNNLCGF